LSQLKNTDLIQEKKRRTLTVKTGVSHLKIRQTIWHRILALFRVIFS